MIEDDTNLSELFRLALSQQGHEVQLARRGSEAKRIFKESGAPDVALVDMGLPDITGTELLRWIRARADGAHSLLIVLSGHDNKRMEEKALEAGADVYLLKPPDFKHLNELIAKGKSTP